jgi:hypothetical protein
VATATTTNSTAGKIVRSGAGLCGGRRFMTS